jgi:hypothetical protein
VEIPREMKVKSEREQRYKQRSSRAHVHLRHDRVRILRVEIDSIRKQVVDTKEHFQSP